ncbi:MAG: molybdenum cofactor cytidylyltransferase [Anaerolineae bacterium]
MKLGTALRLRPGQVVAFVGGGGKTSAMFQLAAELAPTLRVLTTTSTRIFAAQISRAPAHVTFDSTTQSLPDILPLLEAALARHGQVLLVGQADAASGKAFGVPPYVVDQLAQTGRFDVILNEADGSRMRPFKAPAGHEPVIPAATTLVVPVVGLDVLGQPLTDETVHRAELVSRLSGTPPGATITAQTVVAVLGHPQGGLKNAPPQARVVPLLNKAETADRRAAALQISDALLANPAIDEVLTGSLQQHGIEQVAGRVAVVILAAGGSSRFGSAKQLARWGNTTFIERAADTALQAAVDAVVVVLGAKAGACRRALGNRPLQIVENPNWAQGQSGSMRAGLDALPAHTSAALFLLADQPAIEPDILAALIERHRRTLAPVIWPEFQGRRGNPVLFDRRLFAALRQVQGDTGGRPVLEAYQAEAERVPVNSPAILLDVDRPEDIGGGENEP